MDPMPSEYFETHFRCDDPAGDWPAEFVIITAYATTGEDWPEEKNREADKRLEADLRRQGLWVRRVTGYSPATGHAEPGWATNLPLAEACDVGRDYLQDAIYHITGDVLSVTRCDERRGLEHFQLPSSGYPAWRK